MSDTTARLELPLIAPSQAQKHVTHNEALRILDGITQLVLTDIGANTPPASPETGQVYAIGPAPTGHWAGQAGQLAQWDGTAWVFITPREGWRGWDAGGVRDVIFAGGGWAAPIPDLQNVSGVGINAASDATNALSVSADATLLSHAGAGHQLKINKAGAGDTASLLYQSGFSGRAEMGLAGNDAFAIKVSADGAAWTEALSIAPATGRVTGAAVQAGPTDTTPGRLARADYTYGRGNLTGTVGQTGGLPTGAAMEKGSNANGEYVRFADGTQICWHKILLSGVAGPILSGSWTFPAAFLGRGFVQATPMDYRDGAASGQGTWTAATLAIVSTRVTSGISTTLYFGQTGNWGPTDKADLHVSAFGRWF